MRKGKSTTGNKKDLAVHVLVSFKSNESIVGCLKDVSDCLEREYNSLLSQSGIEDPRKLNENVWQNNLDALGDIFQYILEMKAFVTDYLVKYKARKALSYFRCSRVHQVPTYTPKDSEDLVVLKSSVT